MSNSTSIHAMTLGALLLGAATLAPTAQAQSCGSSDSAVHSSYPADGTAGVPTNAPLYVYGAELESASSDVTLQDESGAAVMIDVQPVDGGLLVDAFLGLDPNTTYVLTVSVGGEDWSARFATGAGPASPAQLRAPDVGVSVIEQDRGGACGVVSAICVIGTVSARRTLEVVIGDEVLSLGDEPAPAYAANAGPIAANGCVEVRVREPGGSVSETTRVCGDDLGRFELAANAAAPTSCQAYRTASAASDDDDDDDSDSSESGGCALSAPGAASGASGALFGLVALLVARGVARKGRRER